MSTRSRILLALLALTLGPLLGVGAWACAHAVRWSQDAVQVRLARGTIEAAIQARTVHAAALDRLAALADRVDLDADALSSLDLAAEGVPALELRDAADRLVWSAGVTEAVPCGPGGSVPVRVVRGGGTLIAHLPVDVVLPASDGVEPRYVLIEEGDQRPVADPQCAAVADLPAGAGSSRSVEAWAVAVPGTNWTVVGLPGATWPAPYGTRTVLVIFGAMFLAVSAAGALVILMRDLRRSLGVLSTAAARIGQGDFTPWLPPPSQDEVGRLSFAIGTMAARLEQVMQQNVRNRQMVAIGELASHVSHEIRNPLSSLKINLQSIDRELRAGAVPSDLPDVVGLCLREIHRLDGTVHGVLRLAGSREMHVAEVDLRTVLEDALETVRPQVEAQGITLEARLEPVRVAVDVAQMRGVFVNLLLNAHDVLPRGGNIDVVMESRPDASGVRVHVVDDGPGVPAADRERIFQPFFTTKVNGTGIGLPLAARIVEAHGGTLRLEHTGPGAHFVIEMPAVRARRGWLRRPRREELATVEAV